MREKVLSTESIIHQRVMRFGLGLGLTLAVCSVSQYALANQANQCRAADTTSCSDLGILIKNPSKFYSFSAAQKTTSGGVQTKLSTELKKDSSIFTVLGQSTYGPEGAISLYNSFDNISIRIEYQQNYCFFSAGDISVGVYTTSSTNLVSLDCTAYKGSYGNSSGCIKCEVKTPNYTPVKLQKQYVGESNACPWQNKIKPQGCPPYVRYLPNRSKRLLQALSVGKDGLLYNEKGAKFDTSNADFVHSDHAAIFIMGFDGRLYASNSFHVGLVHHSTFFAGRSVAAAGELQVSNGVIKSMTNCSGHYRPPYSVTEQAVKSLKAQGYKKTFPYHDCAKLTLKRSLDFELVE